MKKCLCIFLVCLCLLTAGCQAAPTADIAATTLPVYEFTSRLCEGTSLTVTPIVTEAVSCLHDYSLSVEQMRTIASSKMVIISGGGAGGISGGRLGWSRFCGGFLLRGGAALSPGRT